MATIVQRLAIWDLDNCLSNDEWRIPLIEWDKTGDAKYARYHEEGPGDEAGNLDTFHAVSQMATPVFFTARPALYRRQTEAWIKTHLGLAKPCVLMRANGISAPSVEVKHLMLQGFLQGAMDFIAAANQPVHIFAAFDDHPEIVAMYRRASIPTALLKIHDTSAYERPKS